MIDFRGLHKSYDSFHAVAPLTLSIGAGEVFGFLGPNGAGKTTTIRMMMGILVPSGGSVDIGGSDCQREAVAVKRKVGYLPDTPVFYDYLRAREILEFVGEMHGMPRSAAVARAAQLIAEFGLQEAAEEYAVNFSLGMKKKLGLACAVIHDPAVLILDEPINGLDPRASRDVQRLMLDWAARGKTVFVSTHLLDMAEKLCTRVAIINRGQLIATGSMDELRTLQASQGTLEELFLELTQEDGQA